MAGFKNCLSVFAIKFKADAYLPPILVKNKQVTYMAPIAISHHVDFQLQFLTMWICVKYNSD